MQISNTLPQFKEKAALLAVCGKQTAHFYLAHKGRIEEVEAFKIETPKYADNRDGFYMSTAEAGMPGGGATSASEHKKQKVTEDFIKAFRDNLKLVEHEDEIYVFAPDYMTGAIKEAFPAKLENKVKCLFKGNYTEHHPFELLEKIAKQAPEPVDHHLTKEASKILER